MADIVVRNDEVVGSIPTSSTMFSSTCKHSGSQSCHTLSHKSEPARPGVASTFERRTFWRIVGTILSGHFYVISLDMPLL